MKVIVDTSKERENYIKEKLDRELSLGRVRVCGYTSPHSYVTCYTKFALDEDDRDKLRDIKVSGFSVNCPVCHNRREYGWTWTDREDRIVMAIPVSLISLILMVSIWLT